MRAVFEHIEAEGERCLARVRRLVRQPSVSATGEGIDECAGLVATMIEEVGGEAQVMPTAGHPVVLGRLWTGRPRTLLVYGMYDVQPAAECGWSVLPFAGAVKDVPGLGSCLVARGATNSKGPLAGFLNAIEAIQHRDKDGLPVNVLFLIEGEEELGSPHLPEFVQRHKDALQEADAVYFPAFRETRDGKAYVQLGTKGVLFAELRVRGGSWGGPSHHAIHGAYNAWIGSPVWRAIHMLATLVDVNERILVPEICASAPPDEDDRNALVELGEVFDPTATLSEYGATRFKYEGAPHELLQHLLFDPVLNLSGIHAGHVDVGTKSIVPSEVVIRCEFRLSPNTHPQAALDALRSHLEERGYGDVQIEVLAANKGSKIPLREPVVQALLGAYRDAGTQPYVHPVNPGWAPLYLFSDLLGLPYVLGGLGHGERAHSADELCTVEGVLRFEKCAAAFLYRFGLK